MNVFSNFECDLAARSKNLLWEPSLRWRPSRPLTWTSMRIADSLPVIHHGKKRYQISGRDSSFFFHLLKFAYIISPTPHFNGESRSRGGHAARRKPSRFAVSSSSARNSSAWRRSLPNRRTYRIGFRVLISKRIQETTHVGT